MPLAVSLSTIGGSRRDQLDRMIQAGLVETGRVFALSLEPVRASLGDRWDHKKEQIWDAAERALEKGLPPPDVFLRIDETTFVAAIACADPYEGQVRCAEILRGLLAFFLGRSADDDVVLTRVSSLSGGRLESERIDPFAPRLLRDPIGTPPSDVHPKPRSPDDWTPPLAGRRHVACIETAADGPVDMELEITPVWRLDQGVVGAFRVNRVFRGSGEPSPAQAEAMDRATVDFLLPLLDEYRREGGVFALIAPLSFTTLSPSRPRLSLIQRWGHDADLMRQVVILEIEGVGAGVPMGRTGATAAMLASFFRGLVLRIDDAVVAATALGEHAFNGVTIDLASLRSRAALGPLIKAARHRTRNIMILNAPDALDQTALKRAGVTHLTAVEEAGGEAPESIRPGASAQA